MSTQSFNVKKSLGFKAQAAAPVSPDIGEIYLSTDGNHYRWDGDTWRNLASGGATTFEINQTSHGFSLGNGIYHNGTSWVKAKADDGATLSTAVVVEITDANNFIAANFGRFELTGHGFTVGQFYYLSEITDGLPVTVEPIAPNFSCPLFYVESANFIQVLCYRPARQDLESYLGSNQYSADSTAAQTVINFGFWVDLDSKPNFDLFIDGAFLREGAANDYTFTNIVNNQSNQVTLNSPIAAGLNIVATYRGIYQQIDSMPNPMTAAGDLIRGAASGTPERLAIGALGSLLRSNGTTAAWDSSIHVAADGKVGIGTSSPVGVANRTILNVRGTTSSGDFRRGQIIAESFDGLSFLSLSSDTGAGNAPTIDGSSGIIFRTSTDKTATGTERMRIDTSGNVGIGKTPGVQLDLSSDGARKLTTTTWATGSDERLKENIELADLDICYNVIKTLPLKRFTWKASIPEFANVDDRNAVGWIAQDVQTVLPKAVFASNEMGIEQCLTLNPDQIYKMMFGAVQKLITDNDAKDAAISSLQSEVSSLQSENQALQSSLNALITRIEALENA